MTATRTAAPEAVFPLREPPPGTLFRTFGLVALILVPVVVIVTVTEPRALPLAALLPLGLVATVLYVSLRKARTASARVTDAGLVLQAPLARDTIPWHALHVEQARIVDLAAERDLQPRWRQMGLGMVGWRSGYFSLRGGHDALVAIASGAPTVAIPRGARSMILLTPRDPERFLAELRRRAR